MGVLTLSGCCRIWARLAAPSKPPPTGTELRGHQQTQPPTASNPGPRSVTDCPCEARRSLGGESRGVVGCGWRFFSVGLLRPLALGVGLAWWACGSGLDGPSCLPGSVWLQRPPTPCPLSVTVASLDHLPELEGQSSLVTLSPKPRSPGPSRPASSFSSHPDNPTSARPRRGPADFRDWSAARQGSCGLGCRHSFLGAGPQGNLPPPPSVDVNAWWPGQRGSVGQG